MKMTFNRRLILSVLSDSIEGTPPPHSASSVSYNLESAFNAKWGGLYDEMKSVPNKQQIHRTLKELWYGGLVVGNRVKNERCGNLPYWEIQYQLSSDVYRNWLIAECNAVYRQVDKAKHGINFFSSILDIGLPACEIKPLMLRVKSLMQKTHPDKSPGFELEFKQMKQCSIWIKEGISLPMQKPSKAIQGDKKLHLGENK